MLLCESMNGLIEYSKVWCKNWLLDRRGQILWHLKIDCPVNVVKLYHQSLLPRPSSGRGLKKPTARDYVIIPIWKECQCQMTNWKELVEQIAGEYGWPLGMILRITSLVGCWKNLANLGLVFPTCNELLFSLRYFPSHLGAFFFFSVNDP